MNKFLILALIVLPVLLILLFNSTEDIQKEKKELVKESKPLFWKIMLVLLILYVIGLIFEGVSKI